MGNGEMQLQGCRRGSHGKLSLLLLFPTASTMHQLTHAGKEPSPSHMPVNAGVPSWQPSLSRVWVSLRKPEKDCFLWLGKLNASCTSVLARRDGFGQPVPKHSKAFPPGPTHPLK